MSLLQQYVDAFNNKDTEAVGALFEDPDRAIGHGSDGKGAVSNATSDVVRFLGPGRLALGNLQGEEVVVGIFPHEAGGWGRVGFGRLAGERNGKIVQIFWENDATLAWQAELVRAS
jgi:hypothetical protein